MYVPILAGLLLGGFVLGTAVAQDAELYDPAPPPNAAFVRVVNATGQEQPLAAKLADIDFSALNYPDASAYRVVSEGQRPFQVGAKTEQLNIEAGNYYTLAVLGDGEAQKILPIKDAISSNPAKCGVLFYNLSDQPAASLRVPSRKVDVIAGVAPGQMQLREVNALDIDMAVVAGDKEVQAFPTVQLKRRTHLSFILTGAAGDLKALMVHNKTER
jgi:alginate O-acetyltransferase complex protein AlgF